MMMTMTVMTATARTMTTTTTPVGTNVMTGARHSSPFAIATGCRPQRLRPWLHHRAGEGAWEQRHPRGHLAGRKQEDGRGFRLPHHALRGAGLLPLTALSLSVRNCSRLAPPRLTPNRPQVRYTAQGFLDKDKDPVSQDLTSLMGGSSSAIVAHLFPKRKPGVASAMKRSTLGSQFKAQLAKLMEVLRQTEPHFIRCIKPNPQKRPRDFQGAMVLEQLRCECNALRTTGRPHAGGRLPSHRTGQSLIRSEDPCCAASWRSWTAAAPLHGR